MGGKALKGEVFTRRFEKDEFIPITEELITNLRRTLRRVEMPLYYKNKESFGDVDLLVQLDNKFPIYDYIVEKFSPQEIFVNGNCYSFDYKEMQVDLIVTSPEDFDSYLAYLSYNDLGNLIGRLAHMMGLKYGQEGLFYNHYFKDVNLGKIIISKDQRKIYEFLDLDYDRYLLGFDTLEDIFKFVSESKFFNWESYQLANLNKVNRERNAKRKSYMSFLEWVDKNVIDNNHLFVTLETPSDYLDLAKRFFPEAPIELEIRRMEYEAAKDLYIKAKFNGREVIRRFGYFGKDLGDRIIFFKSRYNEDTLNQIILTKDVDYIYGLFEEDMKKYTLIKRDEMN